MVKKIEVINASISNVMKYYEEKILSNPLSDPDNFCYSYMHDYFGNVRLFLYFVAFLLLVYFVFCLLIYLGFDPKELIKSLGENNEENNTE